jgi:hypothetical protein
MKHLDLQATNIKKLLKQRYNEKHGTEYKPIWFASTEVQVEEVEEQSNQLGSSSSQALIPF